MKNQTKTSTKNETVNRFLLTVHKFISDIYLRQPGIVCSRYETRNSRYIYRNKLNKIFFQHDFAFSNEDLNKHLSKGKDPNTKI